MQSKPVYTVADVAELLGVSQPTVIKLFENEPGVIKLARPETLHKRVYCSRRIPRHVYERVAGRLTK